MHDELLLKNQELAESKDQLLTDLKSYVPIDEMNELKGKYSHLLKTLEQRENELDKEKGTDDLSNQGGSESRSSVCLLQ